MGIIILSGLCSILNRVGNLLIRSFLVSNLSKLLLIAHFWWVTWVICSHQSFLAGLGICSFAHSLRLLKSNERLWVIRSDRSGQMSDCEQIAQVAHVKRATGSESLRSLMTNDQQWAIHSGSFMIIEWMSKSLIFSEQIAYLLFSVFCSQKTSNSHKKFD